MIDETILFLTHTDSGNPGLKRHGLGIGPNTDFDCIFVQPLKRVFSNVIVYDIGKRYGEIGVVKANEAIVNAVRSERPKYVLWPSMMYEILESTFQAMRREGTLVIGWFFDDEVRFAEYSSCWIPHLDYCFTNDRESVGRYGKLGLTAIHVVLGSNVEIFRNLDLPKRHELTFVGRKFGDRALWIEQLRARGLKVEAFGRGWLNGYVSTEDMVKIFNTSKINLCFVKSYAIDSRPQIKDRIFHVTMSGGFLLCKYFKGIEEFFEIGKEVVCFTDLDDATGKIEYYLTHEDERQAIAQAGWAKAHCDHTQTSRLLDAFTRIEKITAVRNRGVSTREIRLDMLQHKCRLASFFHLSWAKGLMIEGFPAERWREELSIALLYDQQNTEARRLEQIVRFPAYVRRGLIIVLLISEKVKRYLSFGLRKVPVVRKGKEAAQIISKAFQERGLYRNTRRQFPDSSLADIINRVRYKALSYVENLHIDSGSYGRYRYGVGGKHPILYASVFAVLLRHLLGDLDRLTLEQQKQWIEYISGFQCKDGLFRDPLVANDIAEIEDWWGWRHLTLLSLMALHALSAKPRYPLRYLEPLSVPENMRLWLKHLDWGSRASFSSNAIQNYGAAMQYARQFLGESILQGAIDNLLAGITERCNSQTALWGFGFPDPYVALSEGVQAGYHFWLLYWYEDHGIPHAERAAESICRLQNRMGGFNLKEMNASACEDIDAVDPLVRLAFRYPHLEEIARPAVRKGLEWVLHNFNPDGGACFKRGVSFRYGHDLMFSKANQSSIFATWFRTLTLAYGCGLLKKELPELEQCQFNFLGCPGYQFSPTHNLNTQ